MYERNLYLMKIMAFLDPNVAKVEDAADIRRRG
jgi:hypothetical protein